MAKKLKKLIRKILLGYDVNTVFFSQGGEDATLLALFRDKIETKNSGFYVDIGAYHPVSHSNTFLFYRENWRGINIDARPGSMLEFNKTRPRDINLEVGIGQISDVKPFYIVQEHPTMNSFSKENILENGIDESAITETTIRIEPLAAILDQHIVKDQQIDFMSIDVEGFDLEVLQSNNWEKYTPKVLVIEIACKKLNDLFKHPITLFLEEKGYELVAKNIILSSVGSVFYAHENHQY